MLYPPPSSHPPLYILGGGSIGLLFSVSMRLAAARNTANDSDRHRCRSPPTYPPPVQILPRLLLRPRHQPNTRLYRPLHRGRHGDDDDGRIRGPRSYVLASLRGGFGAADGSEPPRTPAPGYDGVPIDVPVCIVGGPEPGSESDPVRTAAPLAPPYVRNILLTTKAPDAASALRSVLHRLHPTEPSNIVVMTNGVFAVAEELGRVFAEAGGFRLSTSGGGGGTTNHDGDGGGGGDDGGDTFTGVLGADSGARITHGVGGDGNDVPKRVNLILATTTHGAHRREDDPNPDHPHGTHPPTADRTPKDAYRVTHAGLGRTYLQAPSSPETALGSEEEDLAPALVRAWNSAGLRAELVPGVEMDVMNWKKLAANCAINPLTALRGCSNGGLGMARLLADDGGGSGNSGGLDLSYDDPEILCRIVQEVSRVAIAELQSKGASGNRHAGVDNEWIGEQLSHNELIKFVNGVIRDTANNTSSMLQDVLARRYPTEIHYLNGYIARIGSERYGLDMAANQFITDEVEKMTSVYHT